MEDDSQREFAPIDQSVRRAWTRRGLTEDDIRMAIAAPFVREESGRHVVCKAAIRPDCTLLVQYVILDNGMIKLIHASVAEEG